MQISFYDKAYMGVTSRMLYACPVKPVLFKAILHNYILVYKPASNGLDYCENLTLRNIFFKNNLGIFFIAY